MQTIPNLYAQAVRLLEAEFKRAYPKGDVEMFRKKLSKYSTEDLVRTADAVNRFGLAALLEAL